jgi:hypothetical protein
MEAGRIVRFDGDAPRSTPSPIVAAKLRDSSRGAFFFVGSQRTARTANLLHCEIGPFTRPSP